LIKEEGARNIQRSRDSLKQQRRRELQTKEYSILSEYQSLKHF
jgi:hypothetical protein